MGHHDRAGVSQHVDGVVALRVAPLALPDEGLVDLPAAARRGLDLVRPLLLERLRHHALCSRFFEASQEDAKGAAALTNPWPPSTAASR